MLLGHESLTMMEMDRKTLDFVIKGLKQWHALKNKETSITN